MEKSILKTIRKKVGLTMEDDSFDEDLLVDINSCCSYLSQIGVTTFDHFVVDSVDQTWDDCIPDIAHLEDIKTFIWIRVKLVFDPPTNSFLVENLKEQLKEAEWRINVAVDP